MFIIETSENKFLPPYIDMFHRSTKDPNCDSENLLKSDFNVNYDPEYKALAKVDYDYSDEHFKHSVNIKSEPHTAISTSDIGSNIDIKCETLQIKDEQPTCDYSHSGHNNDHIHNDTRHFQCLICLKLYPRKRLLSKHILNHFTKSLRHMNIEEKPYECDICHKKFSQKGNIKAHMRIHTGEKPFECKICCLKFNQKHSLARHTRSHIVGQYGCDICPHKFREEQSLTVHMRKHTGGESYECRTCHKRLIINSNLTGPTHTGAKPYECKICFHKSYHKENLAKYLREHTDEKPYGSDNMKFSENESTHTSEKPLKCDICPYRFNYKSDLTIHMRTHTGEKPYECDICHCRFVRKYDLTRHMRTHT